MENVGFGEAWLKLKGFISGDTSLSVIGGLVKFSTFCKLGEETAPKKVVLKFIEHMLADPGISVMPPSTTNSCSFEQILGSRLQMKPKKKKIDCRRVLEMDSDEIGRLAEEIAHFVDERTGFIDELSRFIEELKDKEREEERKKREKEKEREEERKKRGKEKERGEERQRREREKEMERREEKKRIKEERERKGED